MLKDCVIKRDNSDRLCYKERNRRWIVLKRIKNTNRLCYRENDNILCHIKRTC